MINISVYNFIYMIIKIKFYLYILLFGYVFIIIHIFKYNIELYTNILFGPKKISIEKRFSNIFNLNKKQSFPPISKNKATIYYHLISP